MAESFTPCRHAWWPSIASGLSGEWSREAAMMDLRWHADEARVFGRAFPSRSILVARWGWTDKRVRVLLASPEWVDPFNPTTVADLRGEPRGQARAKQGPAEGQEGANGERLEADTSGERASGGPSKGQARASEGPHARVLHHPPAPSTSEDSAPASGAGTLTPQQQEPPCPDVPTPDSTTPTRPGTAPTATGLASGLTHGMTVPHPTTTPRTVGGSPEHLQAGEPSATSFGDEPPPPSDEDYYASETMDGLPAFDAVNGLLDGAHRGDGAEADRGVEGAPPAPQRRTAAVDAVGSEGARGVGQVVQSGDPRRGAGGHPQGRDGVDRASGANGVGGPERRPGSDGVGTLGADPGRPAPVGLFGALNGPSSASTGASHATAPAEGVAGKGGASGRGKRAPKPPAEPKPVPVANRLIGEWLASHLEAHGEAYVITPVCAKKLRELVKDEPADADLSGWRAAFDAFNRKGFGDFPKGFTAMGFAIDPPRWRQQARAEVAGISTVARNGRPVAPSYADTLRELEEMERAAATRNGAMDATYEVVQ